MVTKARGAGIIGIDGFPVTVECSVRPAQGEERFEIVGLPDTAVREARERVRCAMENSGFRLSGREILINLAPANRKKEGSAFDLPILCALLAAAGLLPIEAIGEENFFVGELSLLGEVRPQNGVLSRTLAARAAGAKRIFVPRENAAEAAVVSGIEVYGVPAFRSLHDHLCGKQLLTREIFDEQACRERAAAAGSPDFADVMGQLRARRAVEIAVAGGHNLLLIGPPGSGKSMIAKRIPGILPPMSFEEALETTRVHSAAGETVDGLILHRPFRTPHHTVSAAGMIGGGSNPRPGEISLADNGVLFLDELPEFSPSVLETLRQPLEDGRVTVTRVAAKVTYPTNFMLVCAMNPCRCGFYGAPGHTCVCRPDDIRRYLGRVSGPLLDRLDLQVEVPALAYAEMHGTPAESSAAIAGRAERARLFAEERFRAAGDKPTQNARMDSAALRKHCALDEEGAALLGAAFDRLGLSARGHDKILRIARTIADLAGQEKIGAMHIAEAIQYRTLDRKYWRGKENE